MNTQNDLNRLIPRRHFLGAAAAAVVGATVLGGRHALADDAAGGSEKPNSVVGGVRIGCITYSYRDSAKTAEETLKDLLEDGLSETELMDTPIRAYTGIGGENKKGPKGEFLAPKLSDEAMAKVREAELAKCVELRKMYNDAGVNIHIHKTPFGSSEADIDFNFEIAKRSAAKPSLPRATISWPRSSPFCREAQDLRRLPQPHQQRSQDRRARSALRAQPIHRVQSRYRPLRRGHQGEEPAPGDRKVSRADHQPASEGPHRRRRQPSLGPGANADQGSVATAQERAVADLRRHRIGIRDPQGSTSVAEVGKCLQYCRDALA